MSRLGGRVASCPTGGSLPRRVAPGSAAAGGTWPIGPMLALLRGIYSTRIQIFIRPLLYFEGSVYFPAFSFIAPVTFFY